MAREEPPPEVFVVGAPRSGTGVLQHLLRLSPAVAWVTPATNAMTGFAAERGLPLGLGFAAARPLDWLTRRLPPERRPSFLEGPFDGTLEGDPLVTADEGSRIWGWHVPDHDHDRLEADDAGPRAREFYREVAQAHREHFPAPVFLSKRPANALRLPFLHRVFPDAGFVHLTRDPRAVGSSILRRTRSSRTDWWGARPPGWRDQLDRPVGAQVGWQVREIVETLRSDARELGLGDAFVELSYEALTERPRPTLERVYEALGLGEAQLEPLEDFLDQLENRNAGWREPLEEQQVEHLLAEVEGLHED